MVPSSPATAVAAPAAAGDASSTSPTSTGGGGLFRALFRSRGGWALADQAVVSFGNFATGLILVRNLEKVEYGVYFLLFGVLQFLHSLHQSLITYPLSVRGAVSDQEDLRKLAGNALFFTLLLAIPLSLGVVIIVGVEQRPGLLPWALAAMFFWQFQETLRRAIMSHLRHHEAIPGDAVSYLGQVAILYFLSTRNLLSLESTFAVVAGTSLVALALHALRLRPHVGVRGDVVPELLRHHWSLGRWVLLTNVITLVTVQAMPWTIAYFHGEEQVAEFGVLAQIMGLSNPVIISIVGVIVPAVAAAAGSGDSRRIAMRYGLLGAALLLPYYLFVLLVPGFAIHLFTADAEYAGLSTALRLFVVTYILVFPAQVMGALLNGLGRTRATFAAQCAFSAATLVLSLPLAALYGITGAVWSGVLPAVAFLVVTGWMSRRAADAAIPSPPPSTRGFDVIVPADGDRPKAAAEGAAA